MGAQESAHGSYCSRDATLSIMSHRLMQSETSAGHASQTIRILRPTAPTLISDGAANCVSVTRSASLYWTSMGHGPRFCGICSSWRSWFFAGRVQVVAAWEAIFRTCKERLKNGAIRRRARPCLTILTEGSSSGRQQPRGQSSVSLIIRSFRESEVASATCGGRPNQSHELTQPASKSCVEGGTLRLALPCQRPEI